MRYLAPSILAADFSKLGDEAVCITNAGADFLHIDVMDGHFVPNISFGAVVMKSLNSIATSPYDVHLMIENPDRYIDDFITEKTEFIVVHQEACIHLHRTVSHIKSLGIKAGVSINPATPVESITEILPFVDLVLIMSVNPGFGGQKFISHTLNKVRKLRVLRENMELDFLIEMDGGITEFNLEDVLNAGVDMVVAGSAIFKDSSDATLNQVKKFKEIMNNE
ncbi:MAG: ribulose-phosphate 3-epimerase [Clostridiales bacterium]|nr:ribulose-phosphate 3-epimerase [Clostridiales bacterium]